MYVKTGGKRSAITAPPVLEIQDGISATVPCKKYKSDENPNVECHIGGVAAFGMALEICRKGKI